MITSTNTSNRGKRTAKRSIPNDTERAIITIMVTESTASLLGMENTRLEDIGGAMENEPYVCRIPPALHKFNACGTETRYWFMCPNGSGNFYVGQVVADIAFFVDPDRFGESESDSSINSEDFDDDYESDEEDGTIGSMDEVVLKRQKVLLRPLVTVKSEAHSNNLTCDANVLYVSRVDSKVQVTSSGWINMCRICHGGESAGSLLAPCNCRGSIALAHIECLEHWLKESSNNSCELCRHHFTIVRQPKYSIPWSIFVFLRHPGEHVRELIFDLLAFSLYTPSAIASTYMLMLLCETIAKSNMSNSRNICRHVMVFSAIFGMAAIDFTYSSWLMLCLQRHKEAWQEWYKTTCNLKVILPEDKKIRRKRRYYEMSEDPD